MRLSNRFTRMLVSAASIGVAVLAVGIASPRALAAPALPPVLLQTAPPSDLSASEVSDRQVTLTWSDANGGLAEFEILRGTTEGGFASLAYLPAGTTQWTDDTVAPETTYEYQVAAVLDGVPSDSNASVTVTTPPSPPAGFGISNVAQRQVTLTWVDPSGGLAEFEIQKRVPFGSFETVAIVGPGVTEWTDLDVLPESDYEYRVRLIHEGVPSKFSSVVGVTTLPIPAPIAPGALAAQVLSATSVSLTWEDRSFDEIQMQVFRGVDGGLPVIVKILPADSTSWTDEGIAAERTYSYTVRAVGAVGPSSPSAAAVVATPASLSLEMVAGRRVDSAKVSADSVSLSLGCLPLAGGTLPDPRTAGFSLGMGAAGGPALVSIPAGDLGWRERNGVFTWRSPRESFVKATLVVDPARGTVRFKASRLQVGPADAAAVRVWVRTGADAGAVTAPWTARKAGQLVY